MFSKKNYQTIDDTVRWRIYVSRVKLNGDTPMPKCVVTSTVIDMTMWSFGSLTHEPWQECNRTMVFWSSISFDWNRRGEFGSMPALTLFQCNWCQHIVASRVPYGDIDLGQNWLRWWLGAVRQHFMNQVRTTNHWGVVAFTRGQFHGKC